MDKMEEHARSAEDACVELKEILDPMADMYSDTLFELPEANPLSEYSLNYSDPRRKLRSSCCAPILFTFE